MYQYQMLTDEEIARVMDQAKQYGPAERRIKWIAVMAVLANYGPRISEVISTPDRDGLRWNQIDFSRNTITFPTLKRRKPTTRTLPLIPAVADLLRQHKMTANGSPYVFPTTKYGRHMVYFAFQRMLHRAGIPPVKLHSLRHSSVSRWVEIDLVLARDIHGHANISTTNTYAHVREMERKFAGFHGIT